LGLLVFGIALAVALLAMWRARRELLARGEPRHAVLAIAVGIGLCGYLAASIFLHDTYLRYVGLYLGFAAGVVKLQREHAQEEGSV
ncbi:MAG TPA: O-antigen ligase domain-containing protein, partial [Thermoanaerobaculia bacterium]|nr:O-antigen ligase domain-containing protein [Thermoanaerobaculia bacterium]